MSPWPGAPKSASSPPINAPSTRYPNTLNEHSSMGDVAEAMRTAFNGLTVQEQAFANLPGQIKTQASAAANTVLENVQSENVTNVVTAFNSVQGRIIYFPGLGIVNDQLGEASYTVQQGDAGAKIIVGDSSTVAINFGSNINTPWFTIIDNDSSSIANLVATSGSMRGAQQIDSGAFAIVYFDGSDWWAGASSSGSGGGTSYVPEGGPTSGRPAVPSLYTVYFDTTIGYPVWFVDSGATGYVNASGVSA
jgi:hypothetical protein